MVGHSTRCPGDGRVSRAGPRRKRLEPHPSRHRGDSTVLVADTVESWMGTGPIRARGPDETRLVRRAALILGAVSVGALIWLFWGGRNGLLLWIGCAAGAAFLVQTVVKRLWRKQ